MRTSFCSLAVAACVSLTAGSTVAQAPKAPSTVPSVATLDSLARSHVYYKWFQQGNTDSVWAHMSPAAQQAMESIAQLKKTTFDKFLSWGKEVDLVDESFARVKNRLEYRRVIRVEKQRGEMRVMLQMDANGALVGWSFQEK